MAAVEAATFIPTADMKRFHILLLATLVAAGLQQALTGCIVRPGIDEGVYYDGYDRGPWFRDGAWADGRGWHGHESADVGISIYPGR